MSFHRHSAPSEGSASRHSTISVGGTRSRSRRGPATVHAASLLSLQLWAISELRNVLPPLGDGVRVARLLFLGVVAALAVALWLCHLLVAFARLFSLSRPFSARRQLASATLAAYLVLACSVLCLVEGWTAIDAVYFATATLTTIGCRDLSVRSVLGKIISSTFSIAGPLAAALFWRDSARARSVPPRQPVVTAAATSAAYNPGRGWPGGTEAQYRLEVDKKRQEQKEEQHQARVADATWAFVGVSMVLLLCAVVFLRVSVPDGGEGDFEGGRGGDLARRTVPNAAHFALLALTTVGPATPPFVVLWSPGARALLIPLMLLGALIFSRAMWAVVDVLCPLLLDDAAAPPHVGGGAGVDGAGASVGLPSASTSLPPMLSRLDGGSDRGTASADRGTPSSHDGRYDGRNVFSPAVFDGGAAGPCPVCAAAAAAAAAAGARAAAAAAAGVAASPGGSSVAASELQQRVQEADGDHMGMKPSLQDEEEETDDDDDEDDGWVSEGEGVLLPGSRHSTIEEGSCISVGGGGAGAGAGAGADDGLVVTSSTASPVVASGDNTADENAQTHPLVLGETPGGGSGSGGRTSSYDDRDVSSLDAAPQVRRSWNSGGVWQGEMLALEQAEQSSAAAAAAAAETAALQRRRAAAAARFRALTGRDSVNNAREAEEQQGEEQEEEEEEEEGQIMEDGTMHSQLPSLSSIGEGDEGAEEDDDDDNFDNDTVGDSSDYKSETNEYNRGGSGVRGHSRVGGAAATEEEEDNKPQTADEFIVKKLIEQGKLGRMEAAKTMLEFEHDGVPRAKSGRKATDAPREDAGGDDEEDDLGMAPPGLARLVGDGKPAGDPRLLGHAQGDPTAAFVGNSNAGATAPATAAVVMGGFREGKGGRGPAPLGTPHWRGGGKGGSGARPPRVVQQQQQQQHVQQVQRLEQEQQQEKREEEAYELELLSQQQQQQQQQQREQQVGGREQEPAVGVTPGKEDADGAFASARSPPLDYDSLAPPGL